MTLTRITFHNHCCDWVFPKLIHNMKINNKCIVQLICIGKRLGQHYRTWHVWVAPSCEVAEEIRFRNNWIYNLKRFTLPPSLEFTPRTCRSQIRHLLILHRPSHGQFLSRRHIIDYFITRLIRKRISRISSRSGELITCRWNNVEMQDLE